MSSVDWPLIEWRESAREFHAREVPDAAGSAVWWNRLDAPALVLGSTQRDPALVDHDACRWAGVDVVRRRSGGGAVLLIPGEVTWIDVVVPTASPGWGADVHTPMRWLGEHLAAVVREVTGDDASSVEVHRGGMVSTPWSSLVCFDGLGPGEVLRHGAKLIGISQRRTRHAARLQCCWYSHHDRERLAALLSVAVRPPPGALRPVATLPADLTVSVVHGLVRRLRTDVDREPPGGPRVAMGGEWG